MQEFIVKKPISGFENVERVVLEKIDDIVSVLKDKEGNVLFSLINPFVLKKDYTFDIPADIKVLLDINENSKIEVYVNAVIRKPLEESLVNFKAPFIFNYDNHTMAQVVLDDVKYAKLGDFLNN